MSSATVFQPLTRNRFFTDRDGVTSTTKAQDDEVRVVWDLTDYLASSETVSSASYSSSGVTTSSTSVSSPQVIFTVTGVGYTKVTATLSTGRTFEKTFRFYEASGPKATDYR